MGSGPGHLPKTNRPASESGHSSPHGHLGPGTRVQHPTMEKWKTKQGSTAATNADPDPVGLWTVSDATEEPFSLRERLYQLEIWPSVSPGSFSLHCKAERIGGYIQTES